MRFNNHSQLAQMTQIIHLHTLACNWNAFGVQTSKDFFITASVLFINKLTIPSCWLAFRFCNNTESDYTCCLKWFNLWIWKLSVLVSEEGYPNKSWWILLSYILNKIQFFNIIFFGSIIHESNNPMTTVKPYFLETLPVGTICKVPQNRHSYIIEENKINECLSKTGMP